MGGRKTPAARLTVQFLVALFAVTVVPGLWRFATLGEVQQTTLNAIYMNALAVLLATWARMSMRQFPGVGRARYVWSTVLTAHAVSLLLVVMLRIPYDRVAIGLGVMLHLLADLWLNTLRTQPKLRYATLPFGRADELDALATLEAVTLERPDAAMPDVDAIAVDFDSDLPDEWQRFLADRALEGVPVMSASNLWELQSGRVRLDRISENDFGTLVPTLGWFELKGLVDRLTAALLLPLLALPMLLIGLAIRVSDGGRALYRQERVGLGGRRFTMLKFRTMSERDDSVDGIRDAQTHDGDARITRIGKGLRKLRLDELPQLLNVLKGEMSFIGPRPEPQLLVKWYEEAIPFYRYRHVVRPGITGWAAVNQGHVNGLDEAMVKLQFDFYYIKNFSPWLDALIVIKTLRTMITGSGAR